MDAALYIDRCSPAIYLYIDIAVQIDISSIVDCTGVWPKHLSLPSIIAMAAKSKSKTEVNKAAEAGSKAAMAKNLIHGDSGRTLKKSPFEVVSWQVVVKNRGEQGSQGRQQGSCAKEQEPQSDEVKAS